MHYYDAVQLHVGHAVLLCCCAAVRAREVLAQSGLGASGGSGFRVKLKVAKNTHVDSALLQFIPFFRLRYLRLPYAIKSYIMRSSDGVVGSWN